MYINYSLSNSAAAFLRALSPAAVSHSPLLTRFLSGPYCALIPAAQRARLGLPRAVTSDAALQPRHPISVRCVGGAVVPVPVELLRPLRRLADLCALFGKWRAQGDAAVSAPPPPSPDGAAAPPPETHAALPLPVHAHVLRAVLDGAFAATVEPLVGGAAAKQQLINTWARSLQQDAPLRAAVLAFAEVAGFEQCAPLLGLGPEA